MTQHLDRVLALEAVRVTEAAAIGVFPLIGRGDERAADAAAVEAMRHAFNKLAIDGVVVGAGGMKVDIALDPLEGTTLTAKALPNALAVMAMAERGSLLNAPDTYMDKIAIGPGYDEDTVDLDAEPGDNIMRLAKAKGVRPSAITALILDRPRHEKIIAGVRKTGAAVQLITDGDVAGVIATTDTAHSGIDIYLGQGGAPEGVLAAAALRCVGGQLQTRLVFRKDEERARAEKLGIRDFNRKYALHDLARGDVVFAATGVTTGTMLEGVRIEDGNILTHSIVMRSATKTVREIKMKHPIGDGD